MATAPRTRRTRSPEGDQQMTFPGVGWSGLLHMEALLGDQPMRITYAAGDLQVMSPSWSHEATVQALEELVKAVGRSSRIRTRSLRSTLWKRPDADAGKMPDAAFYIARAAEVAGRSIEEETDPVPDLAIEVEISHPAKLALEAYARMGVAEVWHFRRPPGRSASLRFLRLEAGAWTPVEASPALPMLDPARVLPLIERAVALDDNDRADLLEAWIRDELRPARRQSKGGG